MKGLLIKDLYLCTINKMTLPIFVIVAAMLLFTGDEDTVFFVIAYFTMLCGMMVLSTVSYDDFDQGTGFLMTLPISRKLYAVEKYVFTFLSVVFGWAFSFTASSLFSIFRNYNVDWQQWILASAGTALVLYLLLVIMLPVQLKYGGDKSRVFMLIIAGSVMVIVLLGKTITENMTVDMVRIMKFVNDTVTNMNLATLVIAFLVVVVVATLFSLRISIGIMQNKEF